MSKKPSVLPVLVLPALVLSALDPAISAQVQTAPAVRSYVYHVTFTKAIPGPAAALAKALGTPGRKAPALTFRVSRSKGGKQ